MPKLTGLQRLQLTIEWIKRGREGYKEEWIRRVCKLKGIEYTPPPLINRRTDK